MSMDLPVPAAAAEITSSWLAAVLGGGKGPESPPEVTRIGERYGFASELYRVSQGGNGSPATLIVKLWSTEGQGGVREALFYRDFGGRAGIPLPSCHHVAIDEETRRGVLVLEDVGRGEQGDCLTMVDIARTRSVARPVAALHARWWGSRTLAGVEWMPCASRYSRDADWFDRHGAQFRERFADRLRPECASLFETAPAVVERSNELLSGLPETMIHGDLHLDNVIFAPDGRAVLDWARVARGPAALDVCDLMLMASPEDQGAVFDLYLAELRGAGVEVSERKMARGVAGALLRKFVACTCGLAGWNPATPREERVLDSAIERAQDALLEGMERWRWKEVFHT
jgi:hypothetical protein